MASVTNLIHPKVFWHFQSYRFWINSVWQLSSLSYSDLILSGRRLKNIRYNRLFPNLSASALMKCCGNHNWLTRWVSTRTEFRWCGFGQELKNGQHRLRIPKVGSSISPIHL